MATTTSTWTTTSSLAHWCHASCTTATLTRSAKRHALLFPTNKCSLSFPPSAPAWSARAQLSWTLDSRMHRVLHSSAALIVKPALGRLIVPRNRSALVHIPQMMIQRPRCSLFHSAGWRLTSQPGLPRPCQSRPCMSERHARCRVDGSAPSPCSRAFFLGSSRSLSSRGEVLPAAVASDAAGATADEGALLSCVQTYTWLILCSICPPVRIAIENFGHFSDL